MENGYDMECLNCGKKLKDHTDEELYNCAKKLLKVKRTKSLHPTDEPTILILQKRRRKRE